MQKFLWASRTDSVHQTNKIELVGCNCFPYYNIILATAVCLQVTIPPVLDVIFLKAIAQF